MKQWQVFRVYLAIKSFEFKGAEELVPNLYFFVFVYLAHSYGSQKEHQLTGVY